MDGRLAASMWVVSNVEGLCRLGGLWLIVDLVIGWQRPLTGLDAGVEVRSETSDLSLLLNAWK